LCVDCWTDVNCDDGQWCNGTEACVNHICQPGMPPCGAVCEQCDEETDTCAWCMFDLSGDGFIGPGDFSFFAGCFGRSYGPTEPCAVTNFDGSPDGFVGPGDFSGFAGCFGSYCATCVNCWGGRGGPRAPEDDGAGELVPLRLVAVRTPTSGDVQPECPRSDAWFAVGSVIHVEVWASAGLREKGLAAVYAAASFEGAKLAVVGVVPSESFTLFARDEPSYLPPTNHSPGWACEVGGCAGLGDTALGAESQWVRVSTLRLRSPGAGQSVVRLVPAGAGYGVALVDRLGVLSSGAVEFGDCRLEVRKVFSTPAGKP
jgi:hypothetical protein